MHVSVGFGFWQLATFDGRLIAPAVTDLRLVMVLPGEVAEIASSCEIMKDFKGSLPSFGDVTYEITDVIGKRFGAWSGKLQTRPEPKPKK
jgi:hypothetical protein